MSDPVPSVEDWAKAKELLRGFRRELPGNSLDDDAIRRFFARGIAIARTGGDVEAFVRRWSAGRETP